MNYACAAMISIVFAAAVSAQQTATTAPGASAAPAKPPAANWKIGDKVEVKWGGLWDEAVVKNKAPSGWLLIQWERGDWFEWVEPWRVRKVGSQIDVPFASSNKKLRKPEPPPAAPPASMPTDRATTGEKTQRQDSAATPVTAVDLAKVDEKLLGESPVWSSAVDATTPKKVAPGPIVLKGGTREFFEKVRRLVPPRGDATTALIAYVDEPPAREATVHAERVDLASGKSLGAIAVPVASIPSDLSPNGQRMLSIVNGFHFGERDRLDVWTVSGNAFKHLISFRPFDDQQAGGRDVEWTAFVDDDHALTLNRDGLLILWQVASAKPVWRMKLGAGAAALSPAGKLLVASESNGDVAVIDPINGALKGRLSADGMRFSDFAFSADGKQLAGLSWDAVRVWDLTSGKLARDVLIPWQAERSSIEWASDGYVLLGGRHLLDLERRIVLWEYNGAQQSTDWAGKCYAILAGDKTNPPMLVAKSLPHGAARQLAATIKPADVLLVQPGMSVSLEVNIEATDAERQSVIESLKKKLADNQVKVADGQPIRLIAQTRQGESKQETYRQFGRGSEDQVNVAQKITRLAFEVDGKIVWETSTASSAGSVLTIKQGQSAQQAADAAARYNIPFLLSARVPAYVTKPREKVAFGSSQLSAK